VNCELRIVNCGEAGALEVCVGDLRGSHVLGSQVVVVCLGGRNREWHIGKIRIGQHVDRISERCSGTRSVGPRVVAKERMVGLFCIQPHVKEQDIVRV
jgi:hypothetical protein